MLPYKPRAKLFALYKEKGDKMSVKTNLTIEIKCHCGKNTIVEVKPATAYVKVTKFICDCGKIFHIHDYMNGCTTYTLVAPEMEKHKNRNRVRCSYPMNKFYIYEDEVPKNIRISTSDDCRDCDGMGNDSCEEIEHCLITIIPAPHPNPDE